MTDINVLIDELPRCGRCGGPTLLVIRVPHSLRRPDGVVLHGRRTVALCARCDAENPVTRGVVAFFVVHESITADTFTAAAPVIREWIDHVTTHPPAYTDADLDDEIVAWRAEHDTSGDDGSGGTGPDGPGPS